MMIASILSCGLIYGLCKVVAIRRGPSPAGLGLLAYSTIWPGIATRPLARRGRPDRGGLALAARGSVTGIVAIASWIALWHSDFGPYAKGWLGILVILGTVHLGLSDVITGGLRAAGFPVRRLFDDPLKSRCLREFWTLRWNVAFVQMNQVVFLPTLRRWCGRYAAAAIFLLSGLLHELAISFPVNAGYGTPLLYFALHAAATHVEGPLRVVRWPAPAARLWTWAWLLIPLPLLFHQAFRDALVLPLVGGAQ